jgi:hypothetical protein
MSNLAMIPITRPNTIHDRIAIGIPPLLLNDVQCKAATMLYPRAGLEGDNVRNR